MKKIRLKLHTLLFSCIMFFCYQVSMANEEYLPAKSPTSQNKVKAFSFNLLLSVYDFDHENLIDKQKAAAKMFSSDGWLSLQNALTKSQLLKSVHKNKYTVTTTPLSPPEITKEGLKKGVYYWVVKFPAMIVFKNELYQQVQYVDLKLILFYKEKLLAQEFIATKGKPVNCKQTSKNITVIEQPAKAN